MWPGFILQSSSFLREALGLQARALQAVEHIAILVKLLKCKMPSSRYWQRELGVE